MSHPRTYASGGVGCARGWPPCQPAVSPSHLRASPHSPPQVVAAARFAQVFRLYQRRKLLRERQSKVLERQQLKFRMRKSRPKGTNLSAMALKRFQRVRARLRAAS